MTDPVERPAIVYLARYGNPDYLARAFLGSLRRHAAGADFDLILLGDSIPPESRERLAFLVRASGSNTPVVAITGSSNGCNSVVDAMIDDEPKELFRKIGEILASNTPSSPKEPHEAATRS